VATVANLFIRIAASSSEFEKTLKGVEAQFNKTGAKLQSVGANLTKAISLPLVAGATAAIKFSADFETAMTKTVTLAGETSASMQKMRVAVLDMSKDVGIGPTKLAEALVAIESTGFTGAQALEILKASAMGSAIGMGEAADVGRAITAVVNAYGEANITAAQAADQLHQTVLVGGADADTLAGELGRVVGVASSLGVSFAEVGAFIATYTKLGLSAAEATTGLSGVLNTILSPSKEARDALAGIGMSAEGLRKQVAEQGLGAALTGLIGKLHGNADATGALFGNVRALAGVMGTAGTQAESYRANLEKIQNSTGSLSTAFKVWEGTTAATWAKFTAGAQAAAIAVGDQLAPAFSRVLQAAMPLLDAVVMMVNWFSQLPQPVQTAALGFLAVFAAIGPVAYAIGSFMKAGAGLIGLLRLIPGAMALAGGSWAILANPITGVIALLVTLAYGFKKVASASENAWSAFQNGGWAAFKGEIGRNVHDDSKSFWKEGRLDGGGSGTGKDIFLGKGDIELTDPAEELKKALQDAQREYGNFGKTGEKAVKNVSAATKELLDYTRGISREAAIYTGVSAGVGNMGGMMSALQTLPSYGNDPRMRPGDNQYRPSLQDAANQFGMSSGSLPTVNSQSEAITDAGYRPGSGPGFRDAFSNVGKDLTSAIISSFTGGGDLSDSISGVIGSKLGDGIGNMLSKSIAGAGSGGGFLGTIIGGFANVIPMFGPILAAVMGPLIDKVVDAVYKSDAERAQEEISNEWGIDISDSTAQSIEETMKSQFKGMDNNRWAAEVMHLADIIDDAGGLAADNIGALEQQFRQAFVFLDEGTYSLQDTKRVLDENFAAFAAYYTDRNELVSANVQEMIRLDQEAGTNSEAVATFVEEQTNKAVTGLQTFLENAKITSQGVADSVGATIGGIFASLTQDGASPLEALTQLGPAIEAFNAQLAQTGLNGGAAFAQIQVLAGIATSEITGPMVQAVAGLNDVFTGLHNAGILTQGMFGGLASQVAATFAGLQAQGVGAQDAMLLMQPSLQRIFELQKQFGYQVDASTQAMLDQAVTAGVVGEQHQSIEQQTLDVQKQQLDVLSAMATALGVTVPNAAATGAAGVTSALAGIQVPDIRVDVRPNWKDWDFPEQPGGATGGTGVRPMATGGIVTRPTRALIGEAGPEAVIPLDEWKQSSINVTVNGTADRDFARVLAKQISLGGDVKTAWRGALN
jgi:TP901 family phage tail tape measure protein